MTNNLNPTRTSDNLDPVVEQSLDNLEVLAGKKPAEAELESTSSQAEESDRSTEEQTLSHVEVEGESENDIEDIEPDSTSFEDALPSQKPFMERRRRLRLWVTMTVLIISLTGALVALSLTPDPKIQEATRLFEEGMASRASGRNSEAIASFENAVRLNPDFTNAHYYMGLAYHALGDRKGVLKQEKILRELDPVLADKLYNLVFQ